MIDIKCEAKITIIVISIVLISSKGYFIFIIFYI